MKNNRSRLNSRVLIKSLLKSFDYIVELSRVINSHLEEYSFSLVVIFPFILDQFGIHCVQTTRERVRPGRKWKMHSQIRTPLRPRNSRKSKAGGRRKLWKCASHRIASQRGWRAGVKPSAHVAKTRVSPSREASVYLACIHMQIPIDMTTFTYCIFALGHILARQFPIVGFRPPVRLIDIIGRAADTRLHFYLHTFANQFEPARLCSLVDHCPSLALLFRCFSSCSRADDWPTIFVLASSLPRGYTRVIYFHAGMCAGCRCDADRRRWFGRGYNFARYYCNLLRIFRVRYLDIHRGFYDRWIWTNSPCSSTWRFWRT